MNFNLRKPKTLLFLLVSAVCLCIFLPYPFTGKAFIVGWDMRTIYVSNFENLRTMMQEWVHHGTAPFWTWASFLGNDFYSSKLFYFNDFFEIPFALTDLKYDYAIMIMTYIKFLIIAFTMYAYAVYNGHRSLTAVLGALMMTFSAYILYVMPHPFFASFFTFLPLYFLCVDRYIKEGKYFGYILMVCFMFLNNYYQFYSLSLFTIIYFIWRWHRTYGSFTNMMKRAFLLIGCYMIGFAMSAFAVLPEALNILANTRVGQRSSTLFYPSLIPYLDYLSGMYMPGTALSLRASTLSSLYSYTTANDSVMNAYLYASSVPALLFPQLFTKKNRDRLNTCIVILVSVIALIPILSSAMHGFSEPSFRWLASPLFLLIANTMILLDDEDALSRKVLQNTLAVLAVLQATTTIIIAVLTGTPVSAVGKELLIPLLFIPPLLLNGTALLQKRGRMLLAGVFIESALISYLSFAGSPVQCDITREEQDLMYKALGDKGEYNRFLLSLDPDNEHQFYRSYVDYANVYWGRSTSYNLNFDIKGMIAYDSTYLPSTNDFIRLDPEHVIHYLPWTFNVTNPDLMNLISTKYAVVTYGGAVPFEHFEFAADYYAVKIYENLDYVNLGRTYTKAISYDDYDPSMTGILQDTLICRPEDLDAVKSLLGQEVCTFDNVYTDGNYLYADIVTTEPGIALTSVPYDGGWHISVNGHETEVFPLSGGLTGIRLDAGENIIEMYFVPRGLRTGIRISMLGLAAAVAALILPKFRKH
ncbi:MAG: YfhO family protein [Solobacterium sp.]|nr:YfhO family protein [Solobacterium sp.]